LACVSRSDIGLLIQAAAVLAFGFVGCDESLPPRLTDPNAIGLGVRIIPGLITVQGGVVGGNAGLIEASVSNIYTEVLQDTPAVNIRCRIWLADFPDSVGLATFDISSLTDKRFLQGGMLTILPHATAFFDKSWDYTTLGGTPFWSMLPLQDRTDAQGPYKLSIPVQVVMSDTLRVFKPVPDYTIGPQSYTIQFQIR